MKILPVWMLFFLVGCGASATSSPTEELPKDPKGLFIKNTKGIKLLDSDGSFSYVFKYDVKNNGNPVEIQEVKIMDIEGNIVNPEINAQNVKQSNISEVMMILNSQIKTDLDFSVSDQILSEYPQDIQEEYINDRNPLRKVKVERVQTGFLSAEMKFTELDKIVLSQGQNFKSRFILPTLKNYDKLNLIVLYKKGEELLECKEIITIPNYIEPGMASKNKLLDVLNASYNGIYEARSFNELEVDEKSSSEYIFSANIKYMTLLDAYYVESPPRKLKIAKFPNVTLVNHFDKKGTEFDSEIKINQKLKSFQWIFEITPDFSEMKTMEDIQKETDDEIVIVDSQKYKDLLKKFTDDLEKKTLETKELFSKFISSGNHFVFELKRGSRSSKVDMYLNYNSEDDSIEGISIDQKNYKKKINGSLNSKNNSVGILLKEDGFIKGHEKSGDKANKIFFLKSHSSEGLSGRYLYGHSEYTISLTTAK